MGGQSVTEWKQTEEEEEDEEDEKGEDEKEEDGRPRASPSASVLRQSCSCCHRLVLESIPLICRWKQYLEYTETCTRVPGLLLNVSELRRMIIVTLKSLSLGFLPSVRGTI